MGSRSREKFVLQVDSEMLATIRSLAQTEGCPLQTLVEEALADLIEKRQQGEPRAHVIDAYQSGHGAFGSLYKKLVNAEDIMNRYRNTLQSLAK